MGLDSAVPRNHSAQIVNVDGAPPAPVAQDQSAIQLARSILREWQTMETYSDVTQQSELEEKRRLAEQLMAEVVDDDTDVLSRALEVAETDLSAAFATASRAKLNVFASILERLKCDEEISEEFDVNRFGIEHRAQRARHTAFHLTLHAKWTVHSHRVRQLVLDADPSVLLPDLASLVCDYLDLEPPAAATATATTTASAKPTTPLTLGTSSVLQNRSLPEHDEPQDPPNKRVKHG